RKLLGKRSDGQSEQRPAAHREDVVERVRRGNRSERARVVDERGEEVDGEDERALVVEPVHSRVVGGIEADQKIFRISRNEAGKKSLESPGRVLRRTAAGRRERRESDRLHAEHCTRKEFECAGGTSRPEQSAFFSSPPDVAAAAPSAAAVVGG